MSTFTGTDGTDFLFGGDGDDIINGLGGDDVLSGGGGSDTIDGGSGSDTLTGGAGNDILTGGTGVDFFQDTSAGLNGDHITDLLPSDRIQITDLSLATANISLSGNVLSYGTGSLAGSVTIENIGPGRLVIRSISSGGIEIRLQESAHNDFNGDGRSDILWRADNGVMTDWLGQANGSFVFNPASYTTTVPTSVHIAGTGDFNGDGRSDILWRADNGLMTDWLGQADGSFVFNAASYTSTVPTSVHIVGTGDFNGDGRDDILWRADDGTMTDWLGQADGSFVFNAASYTTSVPTDVHLIGTGDFNGDGRSDILWRADNGIMTNWLAQADGSFVFNAASYTTSVPTSVHIADIGDFNGDAIDDILWRTDDGTMTNWLGHADGSFSFNPASYTTTVPTSVHIQSPFTHDLFV